MKMSRQKKIERFEKKYKKKGGFAKFENMVNELATLEEIGQYFGFSRQNSAGLYNSFFGGGYGAVQIVRREKQRKEQYKNFEDLEELQNKLLEKGKYRSARKIGYITDVKRISEENSYDIQILRNRSGALDVFINDYKCTISGTRTQTVYHIPKGHPPSVYFRFAVPLKPTDFCIFVIEKDDTKTFHVIPYEMIQHLTLITLKVKYEHVKGTRGNTSSKYAIFRNRWELLAFPKE